MDKYVEFLKARLDEEEPLAKRLVEQFAEEQDDVRHYYASYVLADVAAKRTMLRHIEEYVHEARNRRGDKFWEGCSSAARCMLVSLCEPHASHHQYPGESNG